MTVVLSLLYQDQVMFALYYFSMKEEIRIDWIEIESNRMYDRDMQTTARDNESNTVSHR